MTQAKSCNPTPSQCEECLCGLPSSHMANAEAKDYMFHYFGNCIDQLQHIENEKNIPLEPA